MSSRFRVGLTQTVLYLFFIVVSLIMIIPYLFTLSLSFKGQSFSAMTFPAQIIPSHPTLESYRTLLTQTGFLSWTWTTFVVSTVATLAQVFFCSITGYVFAKVQFRGKNVLFATLLASMMVPGAVTLVPLFEIVQRMGWDGTYMALIAPNLVTAFGIFMMRQFIGTIPNELLNAAKIDGCGLLKTYWHVVLPLSKPIIATLVILTFWNQWNNFLWPLVAGTTDNMKMLTVGLASLSLQGITDWGQYMAGSVLAIIPIIVLYVIFQRRFIEGMASGSLKG